MTFQDAAASAADWIAGRLGQTVVPTLLTPGAAARAADGVGYCPWRLDSPRTRQGPHGLVGIGVARFAVWAWAKDPLVACARLDALFFAALADQDWRISESEPPESFWPDGPRLSLTLARDVFHVLPAPAEGKVLQPLVFDVVATTDRNARKRN
jgi:hypothetical protein